MKPTLWTIGGGEGAAGHGPVTASIAVALSETGRSVIAVDADFAAGKLHSQLMAEKTGPTLEDFLADRAAPEHILRVTPWPRLSVIACAADPAAARHLGAEARDKIIDLVSNLRAEYVLLDLGTATSFHVLDLFNLSDEGIVLHAADASASASAYGFLRSAILRKIERRFGESDRVARGLVRLRRASAEPSTMDEICATLAETEPAVAGGIAAMLDETRPCLLVHRSRSGRDRVAAEVIEAAARKFLNLNVRFCGLLGSALPRPATGPSLADVDRGHPEGVAAAQLRESVACLLSPTAVLQSEEWLSFVVAPGEPAAPAPESPPAPAPPRERLVSERIMGLNDNIYLGGRQIHVQTEDLGHKTRLIRTQVFSGGRTMQSLRSEYPPTVGPESEPSQIVELMRRQHYRVIQEIERKRPGSPPQGSA